MRLLPVPDGLVGERVDAALARMTGLSRSKVSELCAQGGVRMTGRCWASRTDWWPVASLRSTCLILARWAPHPRLWTA